MKTLIQLVVVALIFGGLSAAGTIFLQPRSTAATAAAADEDHAKTTKEKTEHLEGEASPGDQPDPEAVAAQAQADEEKALLAAEPRTGHNPSAASQIQAADTIPEPSKSDDRPEARVAVRPPFTPDGDEAGAMINVLRERARVAAITERKLTERQDAMQLIFEDLRAEQARMLKIRQRLANELKESRQAVDSALKAVDTERSAMQKEQADIRKSAEDAIRSANQERDKLKMQLEKPATPATDATANSELGGTPEENANLKKMAGVFDSMPADDVARVFEQLVKNKKISSVVSLMNAMKERQAAKVLAVITETNADLAADLSDRLKRLKPPTEK